MSLKKLENHFTFGDNWSDYSQSIDELKLKEAEVSISHYFNKEYIKNKSIIDIGCGSGIFSLAALRLGCKNIVSIDLDPVCVDTTKKNIQKYYDGDNWDCRQISVFDLDPDKIGVFDIVYSWGVLHHTGAMYDAIYKASCLMSEKGQMLIGLYQKTFLCPFWKVEKKIYSKSSIKVQNIIRSGFHHLYLFLFFLKGVPIKRVIDSYYKNRGMDYHNDLHDWLGGYPYESISPNEFEIYMKSIGYVIIKETLKKEGIGISGSGVNEYLIAKGK